MSNANKPLRVDAHQGEIVHVYDGIEEADNRLPRWWLWSFYLAVIFSVFYWLGYEAFGFGKNPLESYNQARLEALDTGEPVTAEELFKLAEDETMLAEGAALFSRDCARCHGSRGEGKIGPNLTDAYWIGSGDPLEIFETVNRGRQGKGMQAWGPTYGRGGVMQVVAYVLTNVVGNEVAGKAPEGTRWEPPLAKEAPATDAGPAGGGQKTDG
jgi:cytochrome c oxidase cbb3-type subunit 3